jgi:hypothetical protein
MPLASIGLLETAALDGFTTHLELYSQAMRLVEIVPQSTTCCVNYAMITLTPSPQEDLIVATSTQLSPSLSYYH